jgi:hypothetical protein
MFLSSSTRAIVFATDASPKIRCGAQIAADPAGLIQKYGGEAANTKGAAGAIRGRGPALFLRSSGAIWQANHRPGC